jgi:AraC family transcriptional regulator
MLATPNASIATDQSVTPIVVKLLENAGAILERDSLAAKACLARASALLKAALDSQAQESGQAAVRSVVRGGLAPWQIRKVALYIEDNLESTIKLDALSELTRLSTSYFTRAFKESFGIPPHAYVVQQRIRRAQEMMLSTDEPLSQIAIICGLCDQAHFSKLFRRIVGTSPNAWRRQRRVGPLDVTSAVSHEPSVSRMAA